MQIKDEMKKNYCFKDVQEGEVFKYFNNTINKPCYCMKTQNYYEDNEISFNAINLETADLIYVKEDKEVLTATAKLIVK